MSVPAYTIRPARAVRDYMETLGPEEARRLKRALRGLAEGRGDIAALHEPLDEFYRLRVGAHRVIYWHRAGRVIECVYAGHRSLVYVEFERQMLALMRERKSSMPE